MRKFYSFSVFDDCEDEIVFWFNCLDTARKAWKKYKKISEEFFPNGFNPVRSLTEIKTHRYTDYHNIYNAECYCKLTTEGENFEEEF